MRCDAGRSGVGGGAGEPCNDVDLSSCRGYERLVCGGASEELVRSDATREHVRHTAVAVARIEVHAWVRAPAALAGRRAL